MSFLHRHLYIIAYSGMFLLLMVGLFVHSGFTNVKTTFIYFYLPLVLLYVLLNRMHFHIPKHAFNIEPVIPYLAGYSVILTGIHFIVLQKIPLWDALLESQQTAVHATRLEIATQTPLLLTYLQNWNIRALVPFLLIFSYGNKLRKTFILLVAIGIVLSLAFMQKANVLWIFAPLLLYFMFSKKWVSLCVGSLGVLALLFVLVWSTNAALRGGTNDASAVEFDSNTSTNTLISQSLARRIFLVPGHMVGEWYRIIPSEKPFLYGRDFNLYCKLTGKSHEDYSKTLYPLIYPDYAARGLTGTVNAAHFMRSYANFGQLGLVIAAALLSILFLLLNALSLGKYKIIAWSLFTFPLLMLTSGSLMTLMISSGGWLILALVWLQVANKNLTT